MLKVSLRVYLALFLLITVVLILILSHSTPQQSALPTTSLIVDQIMHDVTVHRFDKQGALLQVINMESWFHHQGQTVTQMVSPSLQVFHPDGQWEISAEKGEGFSTEMGEQLEKLHLSLHVVVDRKGNKDSDQLHTENLLFFPRQSIALTDDPVKLYGHGMEIHAVGLRAYFDRHYIELLKDVNCHYAQPQT